MKLQKEKKPKRLGDMNRRRKVVETLTPRKLEPTQWIYSSIHVPVTKAGDDGAVRASASRNQNQTHNHLPSTTTSDSRVFAPKTEPPKVKAVQSLNKTTIKGGERKRKTRTLKRKTTGSGVGTDAHAPTTRQITVLRSSF